MLVPVDGYPMEGTHVHLVRPTWALRLCSGVVVPGSLGGPRCRRKSTEEGSRPTPGPVLCMAGTHQAPSHLLRPHRQPGSVSQSLRPTSKVHLTFAFLWGSQWLWVRGYLLQRRAIVFRVSKMLFAIALTKLSMVSSWKKLVCHLQFLSPCTFSLCTFVIKTGIEF